MKICWKAKIGRFDLEFPLGVMKGWVEPRNQVFEVFAPDSTWVIELLQNSSFSVYPLFKKKIDPKKKDFDTDLYYEENK